jgi:hypothetical protein
MGASRGSEVVQLAQFQLIWNTNTHHVQANDLTVRLLDLSQLHQEVPETGLCDNGVGRKDPHAVQLGRWVCLGRQMAANDLIFCKTT